MASAWLKSLHCKFNAVDDVHHHHHPKSSLSKNPLIPLLSCSGLSSSEPAVPLFPKYPPPRKRRSRRCPKPQPPQSPPPSPNPQTKHKPSASPAPIPTLAELPAGHSSRRVVEIIFASSWSRSVPFPGAIEMLFRVRNPPRAVARFEDCRAAVRSRAAAASGSGGGDSRCAADGNEMMRFSCASGGGGAEAVYDAGVACAAVGGVRTFDGSGAAHDSGAARDSGGNGRRALLVCRVIAGRVRSGSNREDEGDSVRVGKEELVVFDPRAVLPCFLIIYKV